MSTTRILTYCKAPSRSLSHSEVTDGILLAEMLPNTIDLMSARTGCGCVCVCVRESVKLRADMKHDDGECDKLCRTTLAQTWPEYCALLLDFASYRVRGRLDNRS